MGYHEKKQTSIIKVPEEKTGRKEKKADLKKIAADTFPNLGRVLYIQGPEADLSP